MRNSTRFSILGPVLIRTPVTEITVAAPRERVLLALLLLREGQLVPVQQVITALWDTHPPPTARAQVHSCVSRLRQLLRRAGLPEDLVITEPAGYRIKVGPEDLDAALFATRVERGRACAAEGDLTGARDELRSALALWRGRPLADVDSETVRAAAAHLDEQWTAAMAFCLDLELQLDLAEEILAEVADLVERFPLNEQFRGHLMTALARTGRRADALAVFRRGRALLNDELGIEPGAELVELHRRILNGDVTLLLMPHVSRGGIRRPARCLPRDIADFAGRAETVQRIVDALSDGRQAVIAIDGMAGTGKTTLAVRAAHAVSDGYPDGQLYLDLRGHSDRTPLDPGEALGLLLRQLEVPVERVPQGLDERAMLWRTELADRQVLVLLDNALDTAQVLPLLPGSAQTAVIITSRRRLGGLDGVQPLSLDVLPIEDAVELLRRTVGERAFADPASTAEVAELCGRLPLAVRLAAARLQHRPSWSVADLVARLRTADRRLPELAVDGRTVAAAFTLSFQHLPVPLQHLFAVLGLHPPGDFEPSAAAALADLPPAEAEALLEDLVDVHLVEAPAAGRYRLHDLLRDYAAQLAGAATAPAVRRLLDHYLHSVVSATRFMELSDAKTVLRLGPPPPTAKHFATLGDARRWLDRELPNVLSVARLAAESGLHRHTCLMTRAVSPFLFGVGFGETQLDLYERAIAAAVALGDGELEAESRNYQAAVYFRMGRIADALATLQLVVEIAERDGLPRLVGTALTNRAMLLTKLGQYPEAIAAAEAASRVPQRHPDYVVPASLEFKMHNMIGVVHTQAGNYAQALVANRRGMAVARRLGGVRPVAIMMGELGLVHLHLGHLGVATGLLRRALLLKQDSYNQYGAAETLSKLGTAHRIAGRVKDAIACQRAAREQMEQVADVSGQCLAANDLAFSLQALGAQEEARALHREALAKSTRIGDRYEQARALAGLGRTDEAVALFTSLGARDLSALTR
ncbi:BTAD domain-containing putative transcriptional regulator [Dactylosporangium sucinum]|uniref:AfsR/SARP family transcriptional regulator n=1 Tax=Dactylosporangium sucinum TaxID=1424081 RepID=UPI00227B5550|nr:BTAD domain-containing putative transcriptional regulator [Dactylosporangium sucinum]